MHRGVLEPGHAVRSNRESGTGRPDMLTIPRQAGQPGVALELKVAHPSTKTLDQALDEGARQIAGNAYLTEREAAGAEPAHALVVWPLTARKSGCAAPSWPRSPRPSNPVLKYRFGLRTPSLQRADELPARTGPHWPA